MPRKIPVGPPGLEREVRGVGSIQEHWPRGTGFHEESAPWPRHNEFLGVAQRYAEQVAAGERSVYVKAVAREATKRLLRLHLFQQPNRALLVGYRHAGPASNADVLAHVKNLQREMAWEREKWSVQRNTLQWRCYANDPWFVAWLREVPASNLFRWATAYLPEAQRRLPLVRKNLAQLAPLPSEMRKAYFLATTAGRHLLTLAGAEVELEPTTEHHVCLVCQRLLAYHTTKNARHGPVHVAHLTEQLETHLVLKRPAWQSAEQLLDLVHSAGTFSQGRVSRLEADTTMLRVEAALSRAQAVLDGASDLSVELAALRPTHLELEEPCEACKWVRAVEPEEDQLPPFHPGCQCFRLAWRHSEMPDLERKVMLWAFECALGHDKTPRFPFEEFIEACEQRRSTPCSHVNGGSAESRS